MIALILDCETSDLIVNHSVKLERQPEIIEFCSFTTNLETGERLQELEMLIQPKNPISAKITEITGIDLSAPMLAKAREKMASGRYPYVKDVQLMDAHRMTFADATFDCVVAQFVITLVANPEQVLSECHRVVKPGGRIILVNHLYSETGVAAAVERWAAQRTRKLGLRPEFPFARLQAWAEINKDAHLVERRKVAPFGIYTLVCFERVVPSAA